VPKATAAAAALAIQLGVEFILDRKKLYVGPIEEVPIVVRGVQQLILGRRGFMRLGRRRLRSRPLLLLLRSRSLLLLVLPQLRDEPHDVQLSINRAKPTNESDNHSFFY